MEAHHVAHFDNRILAENIPALAIVVASIAAVGGMALAAQDRSTLKVPNGLPFSDFKGYENWQYVAVSQTEKSVKVIAANPAMMKAYRSGVPGNGKPFPDGSKIAKIEWTAKKSAESPYFVMVPDTLKSLSFIERNAKKFEDLRRLGLRPVPERCRDRHADAVRQRRRLRLQLPHRGRSQGLHLHRISAAVNRAPLSYR